MGISGALYRTVRVVSGHRPPPVTQPLPVPASCQQNGDMEVAERVNEGPHDKACTWWCLPMIPLIPAARGLRREEPEGLRILFHVPYLYIHTNTHRECPAIREEPRPHGRTFRIFHSAFQNVICLVDIFPKPNVSAEGEGTGGLHGAILGLTQSPHTTCPTPRASHYTAYIMGGKGQVFGRFQGQRIFISTRVSVYCLYPLSTLKHELSWYNRTEKQKKTKIRHTDWKETEAS